MGVAEPCVRQISRKDRALHAEYIYPQRLFRDTDDTGLYDPPFIDQGLAVLIGVQIEGLPLAKHGCLTACHSAALVMIQAADNEIDLRGEHGRKNTVHPLHKRLVFCAMRNGPGIEHHFFQWDRNTKALVVKDNNGDAGGRLLHATQDSGQNAPGDMRGLDLMPDDLAAFILRFDAIFGVNGQDIRIAASGRYGRLGGRRGRFTVRGFRTFFNGGSAFCVFLRQKRVKRSLTAIADVERHGRAAVQLP